MAEATMETLPADRKLERPNGARDDDCLIRAIQAELAIFRSALLREIAASNSMLERSMRQFLRNVLEEKLANVPARNSVMVSHQSGPALQRPNIAPTQLSNPSSSTCSMSFAHSVSAELSLASTAAMPTVHEDSRKDQSGQSRTMSVEKTESWAPIRTRLCPHSLHTNLHSRHSGRSRASSDQRISKKREAMVFKGADPLEAIGTPEYDVSKFYKTGSVFRSVAVSSIFHHVTVAVIVLNTVYIGLDANENHADSIIDTEWYFLVVQYLFGAFFSVELLIRFCAFARTLDCMNDGWFRFDAVLVSMMTLEVGFRFFIASRISASHTGLLRVVNLLRVVRLARLLKIAPELAMMLKSLIYATRAIFFSFFLLLLLVYVFAIGMHSLLCDSSPMAKYFHTLPRSMWTLFLDGVLLDGTGILIRLMIMKEEHISLAVFVFFILLSSLSVMNMLVGMMCEVFSQVAQAEKQTLAIKFMKKTLLVMLQHLDTDGSGCITETEFRAMLGDPEVSSIFEALRVDSSYFCGLMEMQFASQKGNEHGGEPSLEIPRIMECILKTQGSNVATVQDCINCHMYTHWCIGEALTLQTQQLSDLLRSGKAACVVHAQDTRSEDEGLYFPGQSLPTRSSVNGHVDL